MRGIMEQEIRLLCSGYGAETGSDLLAVKLFENTETGEVHTEITGGIRQGDSPSFSLLHGGFLYTVAELVGEKHAYIYQYRLSEDGIPVPTGKKIFLPGGELCHLYAGKKALYASCYGTGDFFAVDYDLEKIRWHRSPGAGVIDAQTEKSARTRTGSASRITFCTLQILAVTGFTVTS